MANNENNFQAMMGLWQEGQKTFLNAQKEISEGFQKSFADNPYEQERPVSPDPFAQYNQWNELIKTWVPQWDPSSMLGGKSANPFINQDKFNQDNGFSQFLNPTFWTKFAPEQLKPILETIMNGPQFADLATPQVEAAETWQETMDYQKAATEFATVLNGAWEKTYATFSESFTIEDLKSNNMKEAMDAWLTAANSELEKVQQSVPFMDAQKKMLQASMGIKARQRDIAEAWSQAYQIPTRTEIDDLTKTVHELRRELRKLKREISTLKSGGDL